MFKKLFTALILIYFTNTVTEATYFITKINETIHQNVFIDDETKWNPEMYAKKIILDNYLGVITPYTFSLLTELEEIYFAHSIIVSIDPEAFVKLPKLKIIQFSYNKELPTLTKDVFKSAGQLEKIIIGHNVKDSIAEDAFSDHPSLKHIQITKEKLPQTLNKKLFSNSWKLEKIQLHVCNITKIKSDSFDGLDNLEFISIVENNITEIEEKSFKNEKLKEIYLGWNNLTNFTGNELENLKNLKILDISSSPIKHFDYYQLIWNAPNLKMLLIADTKLPCQQKISLFRKNNKFFNILMIPFEFEAKDCPESQKNIIKDIINNVI